MLESISNEELVSRIVKTQCFDMTPHGRHWVVDFIPRENDVGVFYVVLEEHASGALEKPAYHFFVFDSRTGERVCENDEYEKCFNFVKEQFNGEVVPRAQMFFSNIHLSPYYIKKTMNLCKHCRYFRKLDNVVNGYPNNYFCSKEVDDLITGGISTAPCFLMRSSPYFCGGDAKWFEKKDEE